MGKDWKKKSFKKKKRNEDSKGSGAKGTIPIEKLKFSTGDNQAENCQRLVGELAKTVQEKCGAKIAHTLLTESEFNFDEIKPKMTLGTIVLSDKSTDEETLEKEREDKQIAADYTVAIKRHEDAVVKYNTDKEKLCALLLQKCMSVVIVQLEERPDYIKFSLTDPVKLLAEIKKICLTYKGAKHPCFTLQNSVYGLATAKQEKNESTRDFAEKVKTRVNALTQNLEALILAKDPDFWDKRKEERKTIQEEALEECMASLMIIKSNNEIYKELKENMKQQHSLGTKQYPTKLAKSMEILNQNYKRPKGRATKKKDDKEKEEEVKSFVQKTVKEGHRCFRCGKSDCTDKNKCSHKDKPISEWAANKAMKIADRNFAQTQGHGDDQSVASASSQASQAVSAITEASGNSGPQWMCLFQIFQFAEVADEDFRLYILLDTQSGKSLFCYGPHVKGIRLADETLCVRTNANALEVNHRALFGGFGDVWFSKKAITNVLSFAEVRDHPDYSVKYDEEEDCFRVMHIPSKKVVAFKRIGNHYVFKPKRPTANKPMYQMVNAVEENKKLCTPNELKRADRARELLYALGAPTIKDFKFLTRTNMISNNPVTEEDIKLAVKIYGPEIAILKGKMTRKRPTLAKLDVIAIPKKILRWHNKVHLFMDVMFINKKIAFLTSVSKHLMFRHAVYIKKHKSRELH